MKNLINWIEIPVMDFDKALSFYQNILEVEINEMEMHGTRIGFFPSDGNNVSGAIVKGDDYLPSVNGALIYLNGGNDLQDLLDKVTANKGQILQSKTQISPEMGYFGIFLDTEGNKIAVHSNH